MSLRGVDWAMVGGGSTLGAAILTGCVLAAADGPPYGYVRLALVTLAAAAAFVLDEPAAAAVDAAPATLRQRTAARATAAALPLAVWTAGVLGLQHRDPTTPVAALLIEGAGALTVAVALAALLRHAGRDAPGELAATALGATMLALLITDPPPRTVPVFPVSTGWAASTALWASLTTTAALLVRTASRDPYRR